MKHIETVLYSVAILFVTLSAGPPKTSAQSIRPLFTEMRYSSSSDEIRPDFMKQKVSLDAEKVSLGVLLGMIEDQADIEFSYRENTIEGQKKVSVRFANISLNKALHELFENTDIDFIPVRERYVVLKKREVPVQTESTVNGVVTDGKTGETLPGANVALQGTQKGSSTGPDGHFAIHGVEPGNYTLIARFVGYQQASKQVTVQSGQTLTVNLKLNPSAINMKELVVVGYGQQERSRITGSISSVSGDDIQSAQTTNVEEALQGQAAGVLVTQSSGEPGAGIDINIRGASTFGDSNPLYVIDGIPVNNEAGGSINELATINMDNIESIEILKDASATAIYGSRAANGVVMITTKRGEAGKTQVQVSAKGGISNIPENRRLSMMNTKQFHEFSVDAYQSAGLPLPLAWQDPYLSQNLQQNTDWQEAAFKPGSIQNYNVTVSGGSDNAIYSFSGGYLDQEGTMVGNAFNRGSFRINSEFYLGGEDKPLTIGENIELSHSTWQGTVSNDMLKEIFQQSPTVPVYDPDNLGGFAGPTSQTSPGFRLNQVAMLHLRDNENTIQRLLGSTYLQYEILPNLSYKLNLSADISEGKVQNYTPVYDLESNINTDADLSQTNSETRALIAENTLRYNFAINDLNDFKLLAGFTREKRDYGDISATAQSFPNGDLRAIDAATGITTVQGSETASALESFLGRVEYAYGDKYRAQFAIRRDGSSRFGSERRWGTFPSASASWLINNESFMEQLDWLSQLTLRAGYGVTGSQQIPDFAAIPTVEPVANYILGTGQSVAPGSAVLQVGNRKLQWQETKQLDIGLDIGFLDNRLTFVLDYYKKNTSNLLVQLPVATSSGIRRDNGAFQNIGEVENSGLELSMSYQKSVGDFSYQVDGNISTFKNEVKYIGVPSIIVTVSDELGYGQTITKPGSEIGAFYGYVSEGPFKNQAEVDNHADQPGAAPGDLKFKDLNNDGVINGDDRTIIGSPFPDFFYGLTTHFNYKNWALRIQLDGVQGRDIMDLRADNDVKGYNNVTTAYLNRWTPDNPNGTEPRANTNDPNGNLRSSTYRVKDGSFLAIRNVTLGYDFNPETLAKWLTLNNLRVFASVRNLAWITSYDGYNPEIGTTGGGNRASLTRSLDQGTYPMARIFEAGINFGF